MKALIPSHMYGGHAEMTAFRRAHKVLIDKVLGCFAAANLPFVVSNFPVVLRLFFDDAILAGDRSRGICSGDILCDIATAVCR